MLTFVIDEDLPRSTSKILKDKGWTVYDIRDYGLRGSKDADVFHFAQQKNAILLTGDTGFGNLIQFPLGSHYGIVIAHFPNDLTVTELNKQILQSLENLKETDFTGNLIIVEPGKVRLRKK